MFVRTTASQRTVNLFRSAFCQRFVASSLALMLLFGITAASSATTTTVYEQQSRTIGNPATGSISFASTVSDDPLEPRAKAFDNFTLDSSVTISELTWRGAYNNEFNPNSAFRGEIDFDIYIYGNLGNNSPDLNNVLFSTSLDSGLSGIDDGTQVDTTVLPNALQQAGGVVADYSAALPAVELSAGTYWLSIVGSQTLPSPHPDSFPTNPDRHFDPTWSWVTATSGDNLAYQFDAQFDPFEPGFRFNGGCPGRCDMTFSLIATTQDSGVVGDFNEDSQLTTADIDLLAAAVRSGSSDTDFDVTGDGNVNSSDYDFWIDSIYGTLAGDSTLNREVDFNDFLPLADKFGGAGGWADGDYDGDGQVLFNDFVALAQNFGLNAPAGSGEPEDDLLVAAAAHVRGSGVSAMSVPEPSSNFGVLLFLAIAAAQIRKRLN